MIDITAIRERYAALSSTWTSEPGASLATEAKDVRVWRLSRGGAPPRDRRQHDWSGLKEIGRRPSRLTMDGSVVPAGVARSEWRRIPTLVTDLLALVEPDARAIRCRRCAGHARACRS